MNPKILVAYTSKYGSTQQYAEWIAEALGATAKRASEVTAEDIAASDVILCGAYLRIGKYMGADFLTSHWDLLKDKKVGLFTVSGAPGTSPEQAKWFEANIPREVRARVRHFPLQGRSRDLDLKDRMLIWFPKMAWRITYMLDRSPKNKATLESFKPFDGVKREYIQPILDFAKGS